MTVPVVGPAFDASEGRMAMEEITLAYERLEME